jgi:hypothetical protein
MLWLLSAVSGCVWGVIGYWLLSDVRRVERARLALVVSPLIGIAIGYLAVRLGSDRGKRLTVSLVNLYVAAALFGVAIGIGQVMWGSPVTFWNSRSDVLFAMIRWALAPFVVTLLWPLSYVNHALIWRRPTGHGLGGFVVD